LNTEAAYKFTRSNSSGKQSTKQETHDHGDIFRFFSYQKQKLFSNPRIPLV
jgi:hypothetical protein